MKEESLEYLPYGRHQIIDSDVEKVVDLLKNHNLTQGKILENFEEAISSKVSSKYCIAVNSATSALHLSCMAIGLKKNDILWTTPNSFVASANCGAYVGAEIDFVDIDPKTGLMSLRELSRKLELAKLKGKLPKVLIPVHLSGSVCDMKNIKELSQKYNFSVIEDASHAIGAKYINESVGNCKYSDLTVFSFHPVKIITTGEGGCVTTNNKNLFKIIKQLRSHGITKDKEEFEFPSPGDWAYEQQLLGFNYRMSDIQAALGLNQIKRLDQIISERNNKLLFYKEILADLPLELLEIPKNVYSSVHLAVIRLSEKDPYFHRSIFHQLRASGIGVQIHYTPIHLQPFYRRMGFSEGNFPESELYARNAFSIPLYIGLSELDQIRVYKTLKKLLKN